MPDDRFERLEPESSRPPGPSSLPLLNRFEHLEIGAFAPPSPAAGANDILCPCCGQANEKEREICWACYKFLRKRDTPAADSPSQDITLVLDGQTYHSTDPGLPQDIRVLIQNIQKEGYSEKLLADWKNWRATRNSGGQVPMSREAEQIKIFKDPLRPVIRLDGTLYYSDDPNLAPELKRLFDYLAANGVTAQLMEHLRQYGDKVKFRPHTTAAPSDGDIAFWKHVYGSADALDAWSPKFPKTEP